MAYLCDVVFCWPVLCVSWWNMMASLAKLSSGKRYALRNTSESLTYLQDVVIYVLGGIMYLGETVLSLKHSVYSVAMVGKGNMGDNRTWRSLDSSISGRVICVYGNMNVETRNLFPPKKIHRGCNSLPANISHSVQSKRTVNTNNRHTQTSVIKSFHRLTNPTHVFLPKLCVEKCYYPPCLVSYDFSSFCVNYINATCFILKGLYIEFKIPCY